jgi:hypothetical protein
MTRKQSSAAMSTLAAKYVNTTADEIFRSFNVVGIQPDGWFKINLETLAADIRKLAGSVLSQDETKGDAP